MRSATPRTVGAAAALVLALGALPAAAARKVVEDDYPRALALAKEQGVPIVVDVWAPW